MSDGNTNLVLISGKTATGKSASLRGINDPSGLAYCNAENNKRLPFKSGFREINILDPFQVYDVFTQAEGASDIHTIVIDTVTYLMDLFEMIHVNGSTDSRSAWGKYFGYFKELMANYVAKSTKNAIFLAHTSDIYNEKDMAMETMVKVKGSLMNHGIESYFSTVISTKKMSLQKLEKYQSKLLTITPKEERLGFKYVYQTDLTEDTVNERIRSPLGMWDESETFIDNNVQHVIDRLHEYYN